MKAAVTNQKYPRRGQTYWCLDLELPTCRTLRIWCCVRHQWQPKPIDSLYLCSLSILGWGGGGEERRQHSKYPCIHRITNTYFPSSCFWFTFLQFFSVFIFPPDFSFMVASMFEICLREKGLSFLRITYRYIFLHFFPFECYFQCIT